jgi:hypothetical protein
MKAAHGENWMATGAQLLCMVYDVTGTAKFSSLTMRGSGICLFVCLLVGCLVCLLVSTLLQSTCKWYGGSEMERLWEEMVVA